MRAVEADSDVPLVVSHRGGIEGRLGVGARLGVVVVGRLEQLEEDVALLALGRLQVLEFELELGPAGLRRHFARKPVVEADRREGELEVLKAADLVESLAEKVRPIGVHDAGARMWNIDGVEARERGGGVRFGGRE